MSEKAVATEVAEQEFERFAEEMDLDLDTTTMDAEDLKAFNEGRRVIVRAIEQGNLVIDEKGQPIYTPKDGGKPITFYEPTGASFMAGDKRKASEQIARLFSVMADMTRTDAATFSKMKSRDLRVCKTIATFFFA